MVEIDDKITTLQEPNKENPEQINDMQFVNTLDKAINHKWCSKVTIVINKEYFFTVDAFIDSDADLNCISKGIMPIKYFLKTTQVLNIAKGKRCILIKNFQILQLVIIVKSF